MPGRPIGRFAGRTGNLSADSAYRTIISGGLFALADGGILLLAGLTVFDQSWPAAGRNIEKRMI